MTEEEKRIRDATERLRGDRCAKRMVRLRKIVEEHQRARVEGVMVDAWSANAIVKVYDALTPANQERFCALSVPKMASVAFKFVK